MSRPIEPIEFPVKAYCLACKWDGFFTEEELPKDDVAICPKCGEPVFTGEREDRDWAGRGSIPVKPFKKEDIKVVAEVPWIRDE